MVPPGFTVAAILIPSGAPRTFAARRRLENSFPLDFSTPARAARTRSVDANSRGAIETAGWIISTRDDNDLQRTDGERALASVRACADSLLAGGRPLHLLFAFPPPKMPSRSVL